MNTIYPAWPPEDIETLITRPLEEELNTIADVKEITSTSVEGYSSIVLEFDAGWTWTRRSSRSVRRWIIAKPELPAAAEEPSIIEFNFSEVPIMQVNVSGEYGLVRLKEVAEDLQDRIEQIPRVLRGRRSRAAGARGQGRRGPGQAQVLRPGLRRRDRCHPRGERQHPGRPIDVGDAKYLVRVTASSRTPPDRGHRRRHPGDGPIYVRDVATVDFGFKERTASPAWTGNRSSRWTSSSDRARTSSRRPSGEGRRSTDSRPAFPPTTGREDHLRSVGGDPEMVSQPGEQHHLRAHPDRRRAALLPRRRHVVVRRRSSIPLSMLLSFMVLQLIGVTMNMVVLFSLILALGMLVDNAIVVVENIYRYLERAGIERRPRRRRPARSRCRSSRRPRRPWRLSRRCCSGRDDRRVHGATCPQTLIVTLSSSLFVALVIVPDAVLAVHAAGRGEGSRPHASRPLDADRRGAWSLPRASPATPSRPCC